jgi:hypothetical protein
MEAVKENRREKEIGKTREKVTYQVKHPTYYQMPIGDYHILLGICLAK